MSAENATLALWSRLNSFPGGKWLFSRLVTFKAPYFASISPRFEALRSGYCEVRIKKRRAVLNHIGTVHAIAMCNMAELAGGVMTEVTIPADYRWIPKGMTVKYLAKAGSNLRAVAELPKLPEFGESSDLPVAVKVLDENSETVFEATITMWVSPRAGA